MLSYFLSVVWFRTTNQKHLSAVRGATENNFQITETDECSGDRTHGDIFMQFSHILKCDWTESCQRWRTSFYRYRTSRSGIVTMYCISAGKHFSQQWLDACNSASEIKQITGPLGLILPNFRHVSACICACFLKAYGYGWNGVVPNRSPSISRNGNISENYSPSTCGDAMYPHTAVHFMSYNNLCAHLSTYSSA